MGRTYNNILPFLLMLLCLMQSTYAASLSCEQLNALEQTLDKQEVMSLQQKLIGLGFSTNGADGVVGPATKQALKLFCINARFVLNDDLLLMVQNYSTLNKARTDWGATLSSVEFATWLASQSDQKSIVNTLRNGSANDVLAVLARYDQRHHQAQKLWSADDNPVSYALSEADFTSLKSVNEALLQLQAKSYASKSEFDTAVYEALKDVADPEPYQQLIQQFAQLKTGRKLRDASLSKLKLPDYVQQAMLDVVNVNYPNQEVIVAEAGVIDKLSSTTMEFKPEIVLSAYLCEKLAEGALPCAKSDATRIKLINDSFTKLADAHKDDLLMSAVIAELKKLQNIEYKNDKALAWAVKKLLMKMAEDINAYLPLMLDATQNTQTYSLNDVVIPEIYLELLADMQGVDYPNAGLFSLALQAKLSIKGYNNALRQSIFTILDNGAVNIINKDVLKKLTAAKLSPALLLKLEALPGADSTNALKKLIEEMFHKLASDFKLYSPILMAQAKKPHIFDSTKKIQWDGKSCNCVRSNLSGEVYGFYPYWMAGSEQKIDFSVLTRVGYFGLSFDDKGRIANSSRWNGIDTEFIQEARTYGSKVDLVIYRNNWSTWQAMSAKQKEVAFKKLSENIAEQLDVPLNNLFSKIKPIISLGTSSTPIMGDGVTLYFDDYPDDDDSVVAFNKFITTLRAGLTKQNREYSVNIMFHSAEMGKGINTYSNLLALIQRIKGSEKKLNSLFIVLLQEPSSSDKKELRRKIENDLHGEERATLLRNVVTTITFDGHNSDQLADDVIYAKDNFGGIGFWTQPVASGVVAAPESTTISKVLHQKYLNKAEGENSLKSSVCSIVCPNRWAFRIAWDVSILALLSSIFMYFKMCSVQTYIKKNFLYFVAGLALPAVLLTFALMFCDPFWGKMSKGNGLLIVVIAGIVGFGIWNHFDKKRKRKLP